MERFPLSQLCRKVCLIRSSSDDFTGSVCLYIICSAGGEHGGGSVNLDERSVEVNWVDIQVYKRGDLK